MKNYILAITLFILGVSGVLSRTNYPCKTPTVLGSATITKYTVGQGSNDYYHKADGDVQLFFNGGDECNEVYKVGGIIVVVDPYGVLIVRGLWASTTDLDKNTNYIAQKWSAQGRSSYDSGGAAITWVAKRK